MWRRLQWWRRRQQLESDFEEEIRSHIAIEGGEPAAARKAFGNFTRIQEETREAWGWTSLERIWIDVQFGLRMLRKSPGWATVMSLTLALGIGLTTAIFSVVYSVLWQPLPYPQPERLVALWTAGNMGATGLSGQNRMSVGAANFMDWRAQAKLFEDMALVREVANFNLTGDGRPERLQGARTTANLPNVLGVKPLLGRAFTEEEVRSDARVALLSYNLWARRFGSDAAIIGRKIQLNGGPFEVIGVMPRQYVYPTKYFELWTPLFLPPSALQQRVAFDYTSVGRLKPGVTMAQAQEEMSAIMAGLARQYPETNGGRDLGGSPLGVQLESLLDRTVGQIRGMLTLLMAAVGSLLLIGCLNLGILLLARANARSREMALRTALGAGAGRLRTQVLAEVLPLGLAGAVGGIALAWALTRVFEQWLPAQMPRAEAIGLHGPVLGFAVALSLAVVTMAALLPARFASRAHSSNPLQQNSRSVAGGLARSWLVTAQVAIALLVLFGGSLLVRSMVSLMDVDPGFAKDGVLTMHLAVTRAKYPTDDEVARYYSRIVEQIKQIPGVTSAGIVNRLPLNGNQTMLMAFDGQQDVGSVSVESRTITPEYLSAIGIRLIQGRSFTQQDTRETPAVGIIDERIARRAFGEKNPLGKRLRLAVPGTQSPWVEIVGVVKHVQNIDLETDSLPQVYWPHTQWTQDRAALVVRTAGKPEALADAVTAQIHAENPDQALYDIRSMEDWVGRTLQSRTLMTTLVAVFGGAGLLLACLGLYGVVSYSAGLRLREFGIRMALGAGGGHVRRIVLQQAGLLVAVGAAIGLLAAWPVGAALRSLLFGVESSDAISLIVAPGLLLVIALFASLGPANRAARVNPAVTLRGD